MGGYVTVVLADDHITIRIVFPVWHRHAENFIFLLHRSAGGIVPWRHRGALLYHHHWNTFGYTLF